jgi:hypothetical protein
MQPVRRMQHEHEVCVRGYTWISSTRLVMGVPVTTQAWRRQSADVMRAATLEEAATNCASSKTSRQKPNCNSSDLHAHAGAKI